MNKLILGTVQMGISYGVNNKTGQISQQDCFKIFNEAFDVGIRFLDTAETYGQAHKIIGDFHRKSTSKKFQIISKFPSDFSIDSFESKIIKYQNEMFVDSIHTILFHSYENYLKNKNHIKDIIDLKKQKLIQKIGVSVYTNEQMLEVIENDLIDVIQLPFNVFDNRNLRGELIRKAKEKNKIIHTRSCFLQGLFFMDRNSNHKIVQSLKKELQLIDRLSKKYAVTLSELTLNYCLQQEQVDSVLFGVDSIFQLRDNLQSIKKIDERLIKEINKIKIINFDLLNPSLWA